MTTHVLPPLVGAAIIALFASVAQASTLDDVKAKGFVQCGVSQSLPGFSFQEEDGDWTGLDVDLCRGIAAAIFGDPEAAKFTPLSARRRFTALQSGEVDVLVRNTTWTMSHDTQRGVNFAGINYFDGQGFMVPTKMNLNSALELSGASICFVSGTTTELNLADYFAANNMTYEPVAFEKVEEVVAAYDQGLCQAYTTDQSGLYAQRLRLSDPVAHRILPEIISKEPLGPVVSQGDDQWFNIVRWVHFAMLNAEELGITQSNVERMARSESPAIQRLLGVQGRFGEYIGLDNAWALNVITAVGNYGEVFERNVGPDTPLAIARGVNALWSDGGLQYAPPIR